MKIKGMSMRARILSVLLISMVMIFIGCSTTRKSWRDARRDSAGIAPKPEETQEAVLHVYGADAWSWRGIFAIHTWIAAKKTGEDTYKVYDVVGWRARRGKDVMQITEDIPDRYWFGSKPKLLKSHQGEGVDALIDKVDAAAKRYPWKDAYTVFPGPNSNTFVAWVGLEVPELDLDLPFSAIGSGYADNDPEDK